MLKRLLPFACLLIVLQSCVNSSLEADHTHPKKLPRSLTSSEQSLISSGNTFSYNIFRHVVAADNDKNVFISPLSISMALGMTLNGAKGDTKTGIQKTLGVNEMSLQAINHSYQSLIKLLIDLDPKVKMNIANSIWSRKGFSILPTFKDTLKTYYNARAEALDFNNPVASDVINGWVSDETKGRIKKMVPERIPGDIVLYLINAVYFKGNWLYQFDPEDTKSAPFYINDGSTVQVDMMSQEAPLATYHSDEVDMAQMAYGDSLYNMTILMPADHDTPIDNFVKHSVTVDNLQRWTGKLQNRNVIMKLPEFESSYKKTLNDILKSMGMDEAFDGRADFSGINSSAQLVISQVLHKANITVDEEGSEAAAVTSVGFSITSVGGETPIFGVDRPFVYLIRERISGTILFMGVMRNPDN